MEEYLLVGIIIDSFSLDGSLKIISKTDKPEIRFKTGNKLYLVNPEGERSILTVEKYRQNGDLIILKTKEIQTKEDALLLKHYTLEVLKDKNDLKEGYFFFSDLIGCQVINQEGINIGKVSQVEEFPAQITLRIKRNKSNDVLIPFIDVFIKNVDIENKIIKVETIEGML